MPHLRRRILPSFVLHLAVVTAAVIEIPPPNNTRLGQICSQQSSSTWLPHSKTCLKFHVWPSPGKWWNQWWTKLEVPDWDGKLPMIKRRLAVVLDERDFQHFVVSLPSTLAADGPDCVLYKDSEFEPLLKQWSCLNQNIYSQFMYTERKAVSFRKELPAHRISDPLLWEFAGVSYEKCMMECLHEDDCTAFNYAATSRHCQLTIQADHKAVVDPLYDVYYAYPQQY